mgnify:CR=1 FL=1
MSTARDEATSAPFTAHWTRFAACTCVTAALALWSRADWKRHLEPSGGFGSPTEEPHRVSSVLVFVIFWALLSSGSAYRAVRYLHNTVASPGARSAPSRMASAKTVARACFFAHVVIGALLLGCSMAQASPSGIVWRVMGHRMDAVVTVDEAQDLLGWATVTGYEVVSAVTALSSVSLDRGAGGGTWQGVPRRSFPIATVGWPNSGRVMMSVQRGRLGLALGWTLGCALRQWIGYALLDPAHPYYHYYSVHVLRLEPEALPRRPLPPTDDNGSNDEPDLAAFSDIDSQRWFHARMSGPCLALGGVLFIVASIFCSCMSNASPLVLRGGAGEESVSDKLEGNGEGPAAHTAAPGAQPPRPPPPWVASVLLAATFLTTVVASRSLSALRYSFDGHFRPFAESVIDTAVAAVLCLPCWWCHNARGDASPPGARRDSTRSAVGVVRFTHRWLHDRVGGCFLLPLTHPPSPTVAAAAVPFESVTADATTATHERPAAWKTSAVRAKVAVSLALIAVVSLVSARATSGDDLTFTIGLVCIRAVVRILGLWSVALLILGDATSADVVVPTGAPLRSIVAAFNWCVATSMFTPASSPLTGAVYWSFIDLYLGPRRWLRLLATLFFAWGGILIGLRFDRAAGRNTTMAQQEREKLAVGGGTRSASWRATPRVLDGIVEEGVVEMRRYQPSEGSVVPPNH